MGKYDGEGEFTWKDGMKYIGQFKENKIQGKGKWIWPNGDTYER